MEQSRDLTKEALAFFLLLQQQLVQFTGIKKDTCTISAFIDFDSDILDLFQIVAAFRAFHPVGLAQLLALRILIDLKLSFALGLRRFYQLLLISMKPFVLAHFAVICRGADEGQSERDVDGLAKREAFDRDHPLVMVAGEDNVKFSSRSAQKNGVCRKWPTHVEIRIQIAGFNCRDQLRCLLNAEESSFGPVWIDGGDCNSRMLYTPPAQLSVDEPQCALDPILLYIGERFCKWQVSSQQ